MELDLQKASILKRIAAALCDVILIAILATGAWCCINWITGFDSHYAQMDAIAQQYADTYGVDREMSQEKYDAMTPAEREAYKSAVEKADEALNGDEEALRLYTLVVNLILLSASLGILVAVVVVEFVVPLLFGNGQTLGKKIFSLCVIRTDGVKLNNLQLFTRAILGKYAIGIMVPVYGMIMLLMNTISGFLLIVVAGVVLLQVILLVATKNNTMIHDLLAGTLVADYASQRIFRSTEELVEYQKKIAAERAARQTY